MDEPKKTKKPFLKKGTRQFLSNAQVRSQSTKPKIVEYSQQGFQQSIPNPHTAINKQQNNQQQTYQIPGRKKQSKTKSMSKPERSVSPVQIKNRQTEMNNHAPPSRKKSPIIKKKEANIQDYLDDEDIGTIAINKTKKSASKNNYANIHSIKKTAPTPAYKKKGSLTSMLQKQEEQDDCDNDLINNSSFRPIANPAKRQRSRSKSPPLIRNIQKQDKINQQIKQNNISAYMDDEQFNFVSDNSADQKSQQKENKRFNKSPSPDNTHNAHISHIKNKFFNKNSQQQRKQQTIISRPTNKPLAISDIPKALKQQIVLQAIAQQQEQLQQQIQKVKQKVEEANRAKHKFQQANRNLQRQKKQFTKQIQTKQAEFDEKMKAQISKLNREKKYLKDHQMSNKGDWKNKNQVTDLKKVIEDMKQERKRVQKKLKMQLDQVRKKYEEELSKNKILTDQIRILQYGKIAQMEQIKQQKKNIAQKNNQPSKWYDPPKQSYLQLLLDDNFSLIKLPLDQYHYQNNQLYQYYCQIRDEEVPLQRQQQDEGKIKRTYKSGKIENQYINKFIKERFPFDYIITHHINGDVKQELFSRKIIIYFSQNSNATEIKTKNRIITFFHTNGTVQMEEDRTNGKLQEVFNGQRLRRVHPDGRVVQERI